nr:MAG TPA: hypothetical protein [Caudoviricetes sp.]
MKLYTAAVYTNEYVPGMHSPIRWDVLNEHERNIVSNLPNILESYHYVWKDKYVKGMREDGAKIFLDSGAFSAYTLGAKIHLPTYVDYIKRNKDILRVEDGVLMAAVLDGIGDPLETYRNQLSMEALGVKPMPCFHAGEDERYLEWYIQNYDYISLGGMVGSSTKQLMLWLDRVWDKFLVDGSGRPRIKVHGFGITSIPIMERYPWWSCDSSSWIQAGSFGSIVTPEFGPIAISDKSPQRHDAGMHLSTLTPAEQDKVLEALERAGFTYERLSTVYQSRMAYNLWAYGVINAMMNAANDYNHFQAHNQELF